MNDFQSWLTSVASTSECDREVFINGHSVYRLTLMGELKPMPDHPKFKTRDIQAWVHDLGYRLDPGHPSAGGLWSNEGQGFRWHAVIPPIAQEPAAFTLRRQSGFRLRLTDFSGWTTQKLAVEAALQSGDSLAIIGPTGCGKSSFLFALLNEYLREKRLVVIEDIPELPRSVPSWVYLATRPETLVGQRAYGYVDLMADCLRLNPDKIIFGEIRTHGLSSLRGLAASGHGGVIFTAHASSRDQLMRRFEALGPGPALPTHVLSMERFGITNVSMLC